MNNTNCLEFFKNMAQTSDDIKCVKLAKSKDCTDIDAEFILRYANKNTKILDLGTGTGLIVNKIFDKVKSIDCIELYPEFSKFIEKSDNIRIFNVKMDEFNSNEKYDLITIFGTMHYFCELEAKEIYKKYKNYLKSKGKIIIKNQFGLSKDVTVAGYSEEQKTNYFAQYRYINKEIQILKNIKYKNVEAFDIYPLECNRWENTHFYAITAER